MSGVSHLDATTFHSMFMDVISTMVTLSFVIRTWRMKYMGNVEGTREKRNAYKVVIGKSGERDH
jgi:hypothetical protein